MCIFQTDNKKHAERRTFFENGEMAVTLPTQPRFLLGASLLCWTSHSANSTFPTGPLPLSQILQTQRPFLLTKCLRGYFDSDRLRTLSIQTGTSKSLSTWKMTLIILSLSSFADQLLRKAPRTASLDKL